MRIESNRKVPRTNRLSLGVLNMYVKILTKIACGYDVCRHCSRD